MLSSLWVFTFFVYRVNGILGIIVTDRDGTPVISVKVEDAPLEIGLAMKPTFLSTFTMATDQASKLGLGKNQSIVCMYSNYQVSLLLISNEKLLLTFIFFFYRQDYSNEQATAYRNFYRNREL